MSSQSSEKRILHPTIFSSRYFFHLQLKKNIIEVIKLYFNQNRHVKLIDFGCGDMPYKSLFLNKGIDYIPADISNNNNENLLIEKDGTVNVPNNTFQAVLSTQVLEHVDNPVAYLKEAWRMLKHDGLLILSTHGYWMYHPHPHDYWRWTSEGLKKIIIEAGFELVSFKGIGSRSASGLQLFQDGIVNKLPQIIRPVFSAFMQILIFAFNFITKQSTKNEDAGIYFLVAKPMKKDLL